MSHSGDVMRANGGRHEITVHLPKVEKKVTDLFFTLSAYNCGDLSLFKAPSIRFFDAFDDTELAKYTVSSCGGAQAVVLANLQRTSGGSWQVPICVASKHRSRDHIHRETHSQLLRHRLR